MNITPETRAVALIGHPVSHSLSPKLHNTIYEKIGLNYIYMSFDVKQNDLKQAVDGLRSLGFAGFNVTIPHKETIIPYLDSIDSEAEIIGAVNTVKNENGKLTGYNTDGLGFMYSLRKREVVCKGKNIMILGAGGAARAISIYLSRELPDNFYIYNRTYERAEKLTNDINEYMGFNIAKAITCFPEKTDIIINSTSVGMWPDCEENPLEGYKFDFKPLICDIVYNPEMTKMLRLAQENGCRIIKGMDMLIGQAVKAIEIWTGIDAEKINIDKLL